ncbi:MAG: PASTA domain-containing protein [Gammaproteobacteria bacterium]
MNIINPLYPLAALSAGVLLCPAIGLAKPYIGAPNPAPDRIYASTPTDVLFTALVSSPPGKPAIYANGLKLLRVDATGSVLNRLGIMRDDGTFGDETAGDGLFSVRLTLNEPLAGEMYFRASAVYDESTDDDLPPGANPVTSPVSMLEVVEAPNTYVPNLYGLDLSEAQQKIEEAGLRLGEVFERYRVFTKTDKVLNQSPAPDTAVSNGAPVDLLTVQAPPIDPTDTIPDSWSGQWKITTVYRDAETNYINHATENLDDICPDDQFGLALVKEIANEQAGNVTLDECVGNVQENNIHAHCGAQIHVEGCSANVAMSIDMVLLDNARIEGIGSWISSDTCGLALPSQGQTIRMAGIRVEPPKTPPACSPPNTFITKFLFNPLFVLIGGGL